MIKKSTSMSLQVGTQIVEYTWIQQQEQLYLPQHHQWKQVIVDNFEIFLILMVFVYCVTFYFMYKVFSKKNKQIIIHMRKESSASDDLLSSNRQSTEQNEIRRRETSSSTESSPRCSNQEPTLNVVALPDHEIKLEGHKVSEHQEDIIQWERKKENENTIYHIQTRKIISKVEASDEKLQQIKSKHMVFNQTNATGVKLVQEDYANGKPTQIIQILTDWSRFCENGKFEKMYSQPKLIGKGTFGEVFKCQKIFDLREYAVKRVYFKVRNEKTLREHPIFREINVHQEINHKNIVRYYTSWIQELTTDLMTEITKLKQIVAEKQQSSIDSNPYSQKQQFVDDMSYLNDCVQFVGGGNETENEQQIQTVQSKPSKSIASFHYSDYSSQIQSRMRRLHFNPQEEQQYQLFILYIEMELCDFTLKDFIDRVDRKNEKPLIKSIFIQILEGIIFMHSKKYIHRDLKPQNIFINSKNEVKIGDLGLTNTALFKMDEELNPSNSGEYTNNIGTPMYMAPEVKDDAYGQPADIFALGIILFEMLWKIKTSYEKVRLIQGLTKDSILPPDLFKECPVEADLILRMVNKSPSQRPTAQQVLDILKKQ